VIFTCLVAWLMAFCWAIFPLFVLPEAGVHELIMVPGPVQMAGVLSLSYFAMGWLEIALIKRWIRRRQGRVGLSLCMISVLFASVVSLELIRMYIQILRDKFVGELVMLTC
jgi:threonine/homoserine/homoserine lactone efflux protein